MNKSVIQQPLHGFQFAMICLILGAVVSLLMVRAAFPPIPAHVRRMCEQNLEDARRYVLQGQLPPDDFNLHRLVLPATKYRERETFYWTCDSYGRPELVSVIEGDPTSKDIKSYGPEQFKQRPELQYVFRQSLYLWRRDQ